MSTPGALLIAPNVHITAGVVDDLLTEETPLDRGEWRAFYGNWDDGPGDWTIIDVRGITWQLARDVIADLLDRLKTKHYQCPHCTVDTKDGQAKLAATEPGTTYEHNVEGDDLVIVRDQP